MLFLIWGGAFVCLVQMECVCRLLDDKRHEQVLCQLISMNGHCCTSTMSTCIISYFNIHISYFSVRDGK